MCVCVSACLSVGGQAGRPEVSEAREVQWGWAKAMGYDNLGEQGLLW